MLHVLAAVWDLVNDWYAAQHCEFRTAVFRIQQYDRPYVHACTCHDHQLRTQPGNYQHNTPLSPMPQKHVHTTQGQIVSQTTPRLKATYPCSAAVVASLNPALATANLCLLLTASRSFWLTHSALSAAVLAGKLLPAAAASGGCHAMSATFWQTPCPDGTLLVQRRRRCITEPRLGYRRPLLVVDSIKVLLTDPFCPCQQQCWQASCCLLLQLLAAATSLSETC